VVPTSILLFSPQLDPTPSTRICWNCEKTLPPPPTGSNRLITWCFLYPLVLSTHAAIVGSVSNEDVAYIERDRVDAVHSAKGDAADVAAGAGITIGNIYGSERQKNSLTASLQVLEAGECDVSKLRAVRT
jgi:hypothetical protein